MTAKQQPTSTELKGSQQEEQLHFSGRIWHELLHKVRPALFRSALRPVIDLNNYGAGIKEYYFTFVAMELTPNFSEWVGASYVVKHQRLEIAVELPYDQLVVATPEATIKLMETAYLQGIEKIGELNLKYPFDYKAFKADVAAIFSQEDWYQEEKVFN